MNACRTPLSGTSDPLSGPSFPPYSTQRTAVFAIGATQAVIDFEAERDTLITDLITGFLAALDVGTFARISAKYCGTTILDDVDVAAFDGDAFHHAMFRCGVAENKRLRLTITLSAAQVGITTLCINFVGVQGNGCCRGPMPGPRPPAGGGCGIMSPGDEALQGEAYPPYSTTLVVVTDAAGNADVEFEAQRDTLITDLIINTSLEVGPPLLSCGPLVKAEYCNTAIVDDSSASIWDLARFHHGTFVAGVAENKKLAISLRGGDNVTTYLVTLTGVQGAGCCR
jgi:hypothetical protein